MCANPDMFRKPPQRKKKKKERGYAILQCMFQHEIGLSKRQRARTRVVIKNWHLQTSLNIFTHITDHRNTVPTGCRRSPPFEKLRNYSQSRGPRSQLCNWESGSELRRLQKIHMTRHMCTTYNSGHDQSCTKQLSKHSHQWKRKHTLLPRNFTLFFNSTSTLARHRCIFHKLDVCYNVALRGSIRLNQNFIPASLCHAYAKPTIDCHRRATNILASHIKYCHR